MQEAFSFFSLSRFTLFPSAHMHTYSHTGFFAHLAGIAAPVRAPSTEHVLIDEISVVRFLFTFSLGDQLHLGLFQVL